MSLEAQGSHGDPCGDDAPVVPVRAVQAVRFCRGCGAAWQPDWQECPACAVRRSRAGEAVVEARFRSDQGQVKSAVWLYFALLSVSLVALLIMLFDEQRGSVWLEVGSEVVMSVLIVCWCVANRDDVGPLLRKSGSPLYFGLAAGSAVVTFAIASGMIRLIVKYTGLAEIHYRAGFDEAKLGVGWMVLVICVQPAIFEELAFRGVIFGALSRVLGGSEALLVSALMFAILHLSVPSIPHLFLLGLILGWLRLRTGSIFPCVLLHFSHNLLVVASEQYGRFLPW